MNYFFNIIRRIYTRMRFLFLTNEEYARRVGVKIGSECSIATRKFGSEPYLITIGNHVQITTGVSFFTHGGGWVLRREFPDMDIFGKIIVKDNVYVGNNAIILPGVIIEENVVIGAGTVVTKSIPKNSIVAGNPGKIVGTFEGYRSKMIEYNMHTKKLCPHDKKNFLLNCSDIENSKFMEKEYLIKN